MKKLLAAYFTLFLFSNVSAQQLSLGLRTGMGYWTEGKDGKGYKIEALRIQRHTWDNEVFARFATKGRWAFESGLMISDFKGEPLEGPMNDGPYGTDLVSVRYSARNYEWNIAAQYDVTCSYMKQCPIMRALRSYVGLSVTPVWSNVSEYTEYSSSFTSSYKYDYESRFTHFELWAGVSHTLTYSLGKHVLFTSVFDFKLAPGRYFSYDYIDWGFRPTTRAGIRIGAAYKL